jgi:hypothetical protein
MEQFKDKINLRLEMETLILYTKKKQRDVLHKYYALNGNEKHTLDDIARYYHETRQNIPQCMETAFSRMYRIAKKHNKEGVLFLVSTIRSLLKENDGIMKEDTILEYINAYLVEDKENAKYVSMIFPMLPNTLIRQYNNFTYKMFLVRAKINESKKVSELTIVITNVMRQYVGVYISEEVLIENIQKECNLDKDIIRKYLYFCIRIKKENNVWMSTMRISNPHWLYELFKDGKPRHYLSVARELFEKFGVQYSAHRVHTDMIRASFLRLVGTGIYSIGQKNKLNRTGEIIREILKERDGLTGNEIFEKLRKIKSFIKRFSLLVNLNQEIYKGVKKINGRYYLR